jgi:hypothetical protein
LKELLDDDIEQTIVILTVKKLENRKENKRRGITVAVFASPQYGNVRIFRQGTHVYLHW